MSSMPLLASLFTASWYVALVYVKLVVVAVGPRASFAKQVTTEVDGVPHRLVQRKVCLLDTGLSPVVVPVLAVSVCRHVRGVSVVVPSVRRRQAFCEHDLGAMRWQQTSKHVLHNNKNNNLLRFNFC